MLLGLKARRKTFTCMLALKPDPWEFTNNWELNSEVWILQIVSGLWNLREKNALRFAIFAFFIKFSNKRERPLGVSNLWKFVQSRFAVMYGTYMSAVQNKKSVSISVRYDAAYKLYEKKKQSFDKQALKCWEWGLFIKMATGCESQRWGTLVDPRPGRGHGDEWIDCVGSISAESSSCPTIIFHCRSLPVIPRCGHQMCSVLFLWGTWLEKQAETTEGCLSSELGMSRSLTDHRSRSRGSGHRSCTCTANPKNSFLLLCQPFYISRVSLFFFLLLYSNVAQTLKNVGPLDCKLRLLRRRSQLSLGDKISVAEVMHLLTLSVLSANYRVVLVVVAFSFLFSFIHFLPSFLFSFLNLCDDFELFFFE